MVRSKTYNSELNILGQMVALRSNWLLKLVLNQLIKSLSVRKALIVKWLVARNVYERGYDNDSADSTALARDLSAPLKQKPLLPDQRGRVRQGPSHET